MSKLPKLAFAAISLTWLMGAVPAMADSGWTGPGWYEVALAGIIVGPYTSYEECQKVALPDEQSHPDYGYSCVYLGKDPDSN